MDSDTENKNLHNRIFQKASPQARLGAFFIDGAVVGLTTFLVIFILNIIFSSLWLFFFLPIFIVVFAIYNTIFHSVRGQTIGKKLIKIKLVSHLYTDVSFFQTLFRETLGKLLSSLFFLGFVEIVINQKRQGWHDKIAHTYVVQLSADNEFIPVSQEITITRNEKILFYVFLVVGVCMFIFITLCFLLYSFYPIALGYALSSTSSGVSFPF